MHEYDIGWLTAEPCRCRQRSGARRRPKSKYDVLGDGERGIRPSVFLLGSLEQLTDLRREEYSSRFLLCRVVPKRFRRVRARTKVNVE